MSISLGIGLTSRCNFNCSHCYSRSGVDHDLDKETVMALVSELDVQAVNFGTGESYLHPDFVELARYIYERGIKMAVTTNGYTLSRLDDGQLRWFHDIDFSLDFADQQAHDRFRGPGAFAGVMKGIERCQRLNVEASLVCALLKQNYRSVPGLVKLATSLGVNLRVNVYKPVHTREHVLSFEEFWTGVASLLADAAIVSCSEPIINVAIGHQRRDIRGSPCGARSLRVRPDGGVVPCVYWGKSEFTVSDLIGRRRALEDAEFAGFLDQFAREVQVVPEACRECPDVAECGGGCAARRYYRSLPQPDEFCWKVRGVPKPALKATWAPAARDLVHSDYLCTIIVRGR